MPEDYIDVQQPEKRERRGMIILIGLGTLAVFFIAGAFLYGILLDPSTRRNAPNLTVVGAHQQQAAQVTASPETQEYPGNAGALSTTATPDLSATQTYKRLGFQVTAAREALDNGENKECIETYDRLLEEMPRWAVGYYNRGVCKRGIANHTNNLSEFSEYLLAAIEDQDAAIAINPNYGKAYVERMLAYRALAETNQYNGEDQQVFQIAYENALRATALNADHPALEENIPLLLIDMDRCDEAFEEADRLVVNAEIGQYVGDLFFTRGSANVCLGKYEEAFQDIVPLIATDASDDVIAMSTRLLIGAGRTDEAFELVNKNLTCCPDFGGYRYYLRAFLYLEQGEIELARQDVEIGSYSTWYHRGLYPYLIGRLALADGDTEEGIKALRYAASSVRTIEGLWLRERILADLDELGVEYNPPEAEFRWKVTPIPPLDD